MENHPDIAMSYHGLAAIYRAEEDYQKAVNYFFKAYNILFLKLGLMHPNTKAVYNDMIMTYFEWNSEGDFNQWLEEKMKE